MDEERIPIDDTTLSKLQVYRDVIRDARISMEPHLQAARELQSVIERAQAACTELTQGKGVSPGKNVEVDFSTKELIINNGAKPSQPTPSPTSTKPSSGTRVSTPTS